MGVVKWKLIYFGKPTSIFKIIFKYPMLEPRTKYSCNSNYGNQFTLNGDQTMNIDMAIFKSILVESKPLIKVQFSKATWKHFSCFKSILLFFYSNATKKKYVLKLFRKIKIPIGIKFYDLQIVVNTLTHCAML